ncbi:MAG: hypothetical protein EAX95_08225 [Candidatus Thorarchaeota archaeon]|nr:hypothetical protein [Candidatus Thorarchaeota archaeon]
MSVNVASVAAICLYGVFYVGYLLAHPVLIQAIQDALQGADFIALQHTLEEIGTGVLGLTGWVRLALGLGLLLMSFLFILNTGGIIFSVFVHKSFSAGGTPTVSWWRLSLSRALLTVRLLFYVTLYKVTGLTSFSILQEYSQSPLLDIGFFFSSALSLGTLIVLASVVKVVVYEVGRYETMVEANRLRIAKSLTEYLDRWKNDMILLEEGMFSNDSGYVKAKLEDATRTMKADVRLLERSQYDLERISSPRGIIRKLLTAFVGVVLMQILTDVVLYIGWGTILEYLTGFILS